MILQKTTNLPNDKTMISGLLVGEEVGPESFVHSQRVVLRQPRSLSRVKLEAVDAGLLLQVQETLQPPRPRLLVGEVHGTSGLSLPPMRQLGGTCAVLQGRSTKETKGMKLFGVTRRFESSRKMR